MSNSPHFVDRYDGLVRLCAAAPEQYVKQQALLQDAARAAAAGEITLVAGPSWPTLNGVGMDGPAAAPDGLASRLWARGVERLFVARDADPAELLLLARTLAGAPTGEPAGTELQLRTVRLTVAATGAMSGAISGAGDDLVDESALDWTEPQLAARCPFEPAPRDATPTRGVTAEPLEVVVDDDAEDLPGAQRRVAPMINTPILLSTIVAGDKRELGLDALLGLLTGLGKLPDWQRLPELSLILEELGRRAEGALRDGDAPLLCRVVVAVLRAADVEPHHEARLSFRLASRRMLTPSSLRVIAPMLPRLPESREDLLYLLGQAGEEGADAVIEQLIVAESSSDRRVYSNTLVRLKAGERSLLHMLADERWYVVRNAADLLGEMRVMNAEEPLLGALRHDDERVRRSALGALARLGTSRALHAVQDALGASEPGVRAHAAAVLAASSWPYTVAAVRRRLREEPDVDVQLALVAALGRVASGEAIALLAELAEPPRLTLLLRRPNPLRAAALQALVDAHSPAALDVVQRLANDRNGELRSAARRAIEHWPSSVDG